MIDNKYILQNSLYLSQNLKKRNCCFNIKKLNNLYIYKKIFSFILKQKHTLSDSVFIYYNSQNQLSIITYYKHFCKKIFIIFNLLNDNIRHKTEQIPNMLHYSTNNLLHNKVLYRWGKYKLFDTIKHYNFSGIDICGASKLSGSRFMILQNNFAELHRALENFMLDLQTNIYQYKEKHVPELTKYKTFYKAGQFPKFINDQFNITNSDLWLIPTGEVPLINTVCGKLFAIKNFPIKMICVTNCFRKEVGNYGKDTQGILRQHQFKKVELVRIENSINSYKSLEKLKYHAEVILRSLQLPYRVVKLCSENTGFSSSMTYDIEVWIPGEKTYREVSSCSNCTDFQSRRMKTKWKNPWTGIKELVHTLNGSSLAVGRTFVAIIENYQRRNKIIIPCVLRSYMNNKKIILL